VISFSLAFPPISYMHSSPFVLTCPSDPPWCGHSNYTELRVQVMMLLIMQFSPTFHRIIPLRSNILLSTLFLDTLSLCSSLSVRDQVSHSYRIAGKIVVSCILIFKFLDSRWEDKRFWTEWYQALPEFGLLLMSSWMKFWFVTVVPKYLNRSTFSKHLLSIFMSWFCPAFWWLLG
jgi:hypothetical protein